MKDKKTIKMNIPDYWGVGRERPFKSNKLTPNKKSKSAIMSLGQGQPLSSQMWTKGTQFSWTKDKPIHKKNMNYKQANQFFSLCPIGDADKDGVPNWRDCRPYDSTRQGKHIDAFKKKVTDTKEKIQTKTSKAKSPKAKKPSKQTKIEQFSKETKQPDWHMLVKFPNQKWRKVADLKQGKIKSSVEEYKQTFPDVEVVQVTQDNRLLGQLNRKVAMQKAKKTVSDYTKRQGFKSNIKEGLKIKGRESQDIGMDDFGKSDDMAMDEGSRIPIGSPSVGLVAPPSSLGETGGPAVPQPASPQQNVNINMPPASDTAKPYAPLESFNEPHEEPESIEPEDEDLNADFGEDMPPQQAPRPGPTTGPMMTPLSKVRAEPTTSSQRKVPPGAQRYNPVSMEQSTIRRPMLRAPFQDRQKNQSMGGMGGKIVSGGMLGRTTTKPTRPTGVIPMVTFKQAPPFRFMKFGKRVEQ